MLHATRRARVNVTRVNTQWREVPPSSAPRLCFSRLRGAHLVCWVGSMPTTAADWANLFGLTVFVAGLAAAVLQALGPVR